MESGRMKCTVTMQGAGRTFEEEGGDPDEEVDLCAPVGWGVYIRGGVLQPEP
jgi:hypothetical protein